MKRRDFLKVIAALAGSAAVPAFANTLPEEVPDDIELSIGYVIDGAYYSQSSVTVGSFVGKNAETIVFPEAKRFCRVTHLSIAGTLVKLKFPVVFDVHITPSFAVGDLRIELE